MEGRLLARARARQEEIRTDNRITQTRRHSEVCAAIPEIPAIESALRGIMSELVGLALGRGTRSAEELEQESLRLQERRGELLRQHGWPENYLAPIYSCPLCRDTGWREDGICECLKKLYRQEQTRELSPLLRNGQETFENFRLDYYSPVSAVEGERSPREEMQLVLSVCRAYAESFGPGSSNLLFTGAPGLGKTYLSAAIARVIADKGMSVAYDTVTGLLAAFEQEKFSRDTDEQADAASRVRQLLSCDLLIVDDLGTEMTTSFTQSALYSLLDGRLRNGKKTIINTNLDRADIAERYGAALASRLTGEYVWLEFRGRDIRALRKERS